MPRVLLLLPTATYRAEDFLAAAATVGAEVVVASDRRQALDRAMGDRALRIDLRRPDRAAAAIVELAGRTPLDAVVAVDDGGVAAAALASERLGLAHNPAAAVAATRDKVAMRQAFRAAGIPQPAYVVLAPGDDAGAVDLPAVLKPVALSASRGVIRADDAEGARRAHARIRAILADAGEDADGPILAERYVPGVEVAVEALMRAGELEVLAVFDKPDPLEGPYFEETIYVTPSRLAPADPGPDRGDDRGGGPRPRAARGAGARRAAPGRRPGLGARARRPLDRRPVLAGAPLRRRHQPGGGDPASRPASADRPARARAGGVRRDDAPDRGRRAPCARCAGSARPAPWPASRTSASRSPAAGRLSRCPRATATSGSRSRGRRRPAQVEAALREAHAALDVVVDPPG